MLPGGGGPTSSPLGGGGGQWRLSPSHSIWALLESPAGGGGSREALRSPTAFQCARLYYYLLPTQVVALHCQLSTVKYHEVHTTRHTADHTPPRL